ncbi:M20/M25/M40 family metallo-hydrolase [candidate division KSB1 bacterium]|nr:M20/M25/M40 family metallo-hydrolase [candidate division KSB1 bacterium]
MELFTKKISHVFMPIFAFVFLISSPLVSQEKVDLDIVERIKEEGFNRSQVMDYAWHLTDVIGPRLTGSSNMREAQEWTKAKMDQIGLSSTAIESWGEHGVNWDLEYVSLHMLEPDYQVLIGYPQAFTPGTDGIITGEPIIVNIKSKADLDNYKGKLKNAIVLSTPRRQYGPRFTADAIRHDEKSLQVFVEEGIDHNIRERRKEQWMQNPQGPKDLNATELEEFFKSEGVAVVLAAARGGDGTVFVSGRRSNRRDRSLKAVKNSLPTVAIAVEHYNRIHRLVERNIDVKLEIEIRVNSVQRDKQEYNVVGEIPGSDLTHEIVMIGAHLDSWHSGTGATDNASGSATVLEAMRILKAIGAAPRRTIRAALWSNEEGGLRGSRAYVANHFGNPRDGILPDYENFSVYFNMDNGTGRFRGVHQQGNKFVGSIFSEWMKPFYDLEISTLSNFSNRGSDQLSFDQAGLPGFQFIQDRIEYRTRTHHTNMDVFDKLLPEDLKINAVVLAGFAYNAAMRDERIPRKPFTDWRPQFKIAQKDLFKSGNSLTNAIADFDNDGDLDIFVGFRGQPNRLYRNDGGKFTDVAADVGVADNDVTRTAAWGDYNNDGNLDLFVAFVSRQKSWNRLYKNEGNGKRFTDVTKITGVSLTGSFRQACWIDYDNDGDVDLFIGLRDKPNVLFRNDNGKFTNVAKSLNIDDPRRTVGAVWFDFDKDGDLDLYVTNMDGDANGLFRNDGTRFVDVAPELGLDNGGRPLGFSAYGSVRPTLVDFDNDGNIDIFIANYGPNGLFRNLGGSFKNVAAQMGLAIDERYDTGAWGDYDNDGRLDLYVNGTITGGKSYRDYLFHNDGDRFTDITPKILLDQKADHGVHWADFDKDGDLDLALTGAASDGMHHLVLNEIDKKRANRSLQVLVLDARGHYTRAGSEVRLYDANSGVLLGTNILDTGSGYNSQNAMPVHFGLAKQGLVDVEITTLTKQGRKTARLSDIDPKSYIGRWLVVKIDENGNVTK